MVRELWTRISEAGNDHFEDPSHRRANSFINRSYFVFFVLLWLGLITHFVSGAILVPAGWSTNEDFWILTRFMVPAFLATIALVALCFYLKWKTGLYSLFSTIALIGGICFATYLSLLYPRDGGFFLVLLLFLPFPMAVWHMQPRAVSIFSLTVNVLCFFFALWYTQNQTPLVTIPARVAPTLPYFTGSFMVIGFIAYAGHLFSGALASERTLEHERARSERLLNNIIPHLEQSQKRYSHLVEDSKDIIFSLNKRLQIKTVNRALHRVLRFDARKWIGKDFLSLLACEDESDPSYQLAKETLATVIEEKSSETFFAPLRRRYGPESLMMRISVDYSEVDGIVEIIGKASSQERSRVSAFVRKEKGTYYIDNSLSSAEIMSRHLTEGLASRLTDTELAKIQVSTREMLINAIEHGNLAITFAEKSAAHERGEYLDLIHSRQASEEYGERRVRIDYALGRRFLAFRITDEGDGFDASQEGIKNLVNVNATGLAHGRGIAIAQEVFDEVNYSDKGNQVRLVKKLTTAG